MAAKEIRSLIDDIAKFLFDKGRDKADEAWDEKGYTDEKLNQILSKTMITAKELRVGNWINDPRYGAVQVVWIMPVAGELVIKHTGPAPQREQVEYKPIPLTHEILEKCGFKKGALMSGGFYGYDNGTMELDNNFNLELTDGRLSENGTRFYLPQNKSVHQLQNLYFALTGEELEINL